MPRTTIKKSFFLLISLTFLFVIKAPAKILAWAGETHQYLCPQEFGPLNCGIADDYQFKTTYPLGFTWHLCLDNKSDCVPRLLAKYYLKKYYFEGEKDLNLLGAAAHLIQDSYVPDHWFPMREYFGKKIFVPFAPKWVGTVEGIVGNYLSQGEKDWNLPLNYQGKTIRLDNDYLEMIKTEIHRSFNQAPTESLEELEKQIKKADFWQKIRSYREIGYVIVIILAPVLAWQFWRFKKSGKGKFDLMAISLLSIASLIFLGLTFLY